MPNFADKGKMTVRSRMTITVAGTWLPLVLALLGLSVLIGWALDIATLKSVVPGLTTMKANTAACFVMLGIGIAAIGSVWREKRSIALAAAGLVALIGAATLAEYVFHVSFRIDELIVSDRSSTSPPFSGRMSPATALGFLSAGISTWLIAVGRRESVVAAGQTLAFVPACIGFLSLAGYAYGVENLYNFGPFVSVALHTGFGLVVSAAALISTRWEEGWGKPFVDRQIAQKALIKICAMGLVIPFVTGLLVVRGIRAGYYRAGFTPTLFAVASAAGILWVALQSARILAAAERQMIAFAAANEAQALHLAQTNDRHRAIVEGLPQMVWTTRADGYADYFSPQWTDYTGIEESRQLGAGWLDLVIHPADKERTAAHWAGAVAGQHPYDIEYRVRSAAGVYRWFKVRGTPLPDLHGHIVSWFGSSTDIEDIVAAREVLARSRSDLESQVARRTAELMAVEAQLRQSQKMEAVGQLTGGVAHDFNNLLTIIRSAADLLRRPDLAEARRRRYLDAISDTSDRAAKLTGQLLAFSRRQALNPEVFDSAATIANISDMLQSVVGPRIAIVIAPICAPCFMVADVSQFETALVNMAVNARDAMAGEGTLTLRATAADKIPPMRAHPALPGNFVAVSISDTGCGIAEDQLDQIFEPFFTTKAVGKGTGLGLSQVYGFAKQSNGDIGVSSEVGKGTTFTLYLPHADAPRLGATALGAPDRHERSQRRWRAPHSGRRGRHGGGHVLHPSAAGSGLSNALVQQWPGRAGAAQRGHPIRRAVLRYRHAGYERGRARLRGTPALAANADYSHQRLQRSPGRRRAAWL